MKAVAESNELNPMVTPSRWQKYLNEGYISSIGLLLRGIESFQHCIIQFILGHRSAGKWPSTPSIFLSTWDKSISWRLSKPRMVVAAETGLVGNPLSLRPQNSRISGSPSSSLVPRILKTSIFELHEHQSVRGIKYQIPVHFGPIISVMSTSRTETR